MCSLSWGEKKGQGKIINSDGNDSQWHTHEMGEGDEIDLHVKIILNALK